MAALGREKLQPLLVEALGGPHGTDLADSKDNHGFSMLAQLLAAPSEATKEALRMVCSYLLTHGCHSCALVTG